MLENLPPEILQSIIENKTLDFRDLLNLSSTCSYINRFITKNNCLWKYRFQQNYPEIYKKHFPIDDYYLEIKLFYEIRRKVKEILINLTVSYKEQLSDGDFEPFIELIGSKELNWEYLLHYLREILTDKSEINSFDVIPLTTPGNLTLKYYCLATLRYIKQLRLSEAWNNFFSLPEEDQLLEVGASLLVQWCKPQCDITIKEVSEKLDFISEEVKKFLFTIKPEHPIFKVNEETLKHFRGKNIFKNQFSTYHCREILLAMMEVVCKQMDFCGNETDYYHINNSFITDVLESKRGLPITLSIIYESVARRLGVNLDPISSPAHFLLRFNDDDGIKREVSYVDVFNRGTMYSPGVCAYSNSVRSRLSRASTKTVIERMSNNLEVALRDRPQPVNALPLMRSILELNDLLEPSDLNTTVFLARFYMTYGIDTTNLEKNLKKRNYPDQTAVQNVLKMLADYKSHTKNEHTKPTKNINKRPPEVSFAIGMVMEHKLYEYTCVIYGWDNVCKESEEWQRHMRVNQLKYGGNQPFYHVLVEDGSRRYAAQENLEIGGNIKAMETNEEIGRFFSHVFKNHYVPNAMKQEEYPEDADVRRKYYENV